MSLCFGKLQITLKTKFVEGQCLCLITDVSVELIGVFRRSQGFYHLISLP